MQQLAHQVLGGGDGVRQRGQRPITSPTCHRPPWALSSTLERPSPGAGDWQ
ncbi:unnamed protein product [Gulo gulo]|uniref:Uncharacterized protein n=1 Tax=Gulo gulo TaxID=48420 RepID=A0A9X9LM83_GULGU|nr:unnamed protein product [Gulo gulo]